MLPIRILLANHQPIVRSGLRLLLEREPDLQVVAEAATGREAIALADFRLPTFALLEIKLAEMSGIAVARQLLAKHPAIKIIFVTSLTDVAYVTEAFKTGAHGYVIADGAPANLVNAIHKVASDQLFVCPTIPVTESLNALLRLGASNAVLRHSGSG